MSINKEIKSLTGIRGLAALLIMFSHYVSSGWASPINKDNIPALLSAFFGFSYIGMTLFFVLSGFVIAYNYTSLNWAKHPFRACSHFIIYRFARLYPLMLFFILFMYWYHPTLFYPDQSTFYSALLTPATPLRSDIVRHLTMTQSFTPYLDSTGSLVIDGPFSLSWSISIEFFLYLTFAAIMIVGGGLFKSSFSLRMVVYYAGFSLLGAYVWSRQNGTGLFTPLPDKTYYRWLFDVSPYYRMLEFCLGMLGFWIFDHTRHHDSKLTQWLRRWGGLSGLLIVLAIYVAALPAWIRPETFEVKLCCAFGIMLILQACAEPTRLNALFSSAPLMFAGTVSYSLYLFHFLAPNIIAMRLGNYPLTTKSAVIFGINLLFSAALSLALAAGFYRMIEVPGRNLIRQLYHGKQ